MRSGFYILYCLPLVMAASVAEAAPAAKAYGTGGTGLPDVEINLDAIAAPAPAPAPAPVAPALPAAPLAATPAAIPAPSLAAAPAPAEQPAIHEPVMLNADGSTPAPAAPAGEPSSNASSSSLATAGTPANGYVEAGGNYHSLSNDYGTWNGQYIKGEFQSDSANRWNAELLHEREFSESGYYGTFGNTHVIDEDWYTVVDVGAGTPADASFFPRYRVDGFLNRKLLPDRSLVATVGAGYSKALRTYNDADLYLGATYYIAPTWTTQVGYRFNNTNPNSAHSDSYFVALTQGRDKDYYITGRYGAGKEAYQLIGPAGSLVDFNSQIYSLELRKWIIEDMGFDVRGEHYHNPSYDRDGINFGIFKEF